VSPQQVHTVAEAAKNAARALAGVPTERRNAAIRMAAELIGQSRDQLLEANVCDLAAAQLMIDQGQLIPSTLDRLRLDEKKIAEMMQAMLAVAELPDPIGRVSQRTELDAGLVLERIICPLGVLAIIFEARPDAVTQISALGLKSANAVILKAGREVEQTAAALVKIIQQALGKAGLPVDAVTLVAGREVVHQLLAMNDLIDMVIPRGSRQLVEFVKANTRIPVLGHAEGICHVYVDKAAKLDMAKTIVLNAKMRRTGVCGAAETLLVDRAAASTHLKPLVTMLLDAGCEVRGDETMRAIDQRVKPASEQDWSTEYLDAIISAKVVDGVDGAIRHIERFGSHHTDSIVTEDQATAEKFLNEIDSAIVLHNASTQFADGGEFGFGAEIGIATGRFHARGPVGVEQLTSFKYRVRGAGQIRP